MAKDDNVKLSAEDREFIESRTRAEQHQAALAEESQQQRTAAAKVAAGEVKKTVQVTVTKFGEGKVSTGVHIATVGDVMAKQGDVLEVAEDIATALEARGFAEK